MKRYRGLDESQRLSAQAALGCTQEFICMAGSTVTLPSPSVSSLTKDGGLYSIQMECKEIVCHSWRDGGHSSPELEWGAGATLWLVVTWLLPAKPIPD